jgi:hypothetical protein
MIGHHFGVYGMSRLSRGSSDNLLYLRVLQFPGLIRASQVGDDSVEVLGAYPVRHSQRWRSCARSKDEHFRPLRHADLANLSVAETRI